MKAKVVKMLIMVGCLVPLCFSFAVAEELAIIECETTAIADIVSLEGICVYAFLENEILIGADFEDLQDLRRDCSRLEEIDTRQEDSEYFLLRIDKQDTVKLEEEIDLIYYNGREAVARVDGATDLSTYRFVKGLTRISFVPMPAVDRYALETSFVLPDLADSVIQEIIDQVDQAQFAGVIQRLQDFQTRWAYTDSCRAAELWVLDTLAAMGYQTELFPFQYQGYTWYNVIGRKRGVLYPDSIYIISGHVDSRSYENPDYLAPGAEDNATAVACVLEAARIFTQYDSDCTIEFFVPSGEEQGLIGSEAYARYCLNNHRNIAGVLNYDMISYADDYGWNVVVYADANFPAEQELARLYAQLVEQYTLAFPERINTNGPQWGSDHYYFSLYGFPAIFGIDAEIWYGPDWYPWYHSTDDVIDHLVLDFGVEVVKSGLATMATLAGLTTPPAVAMTCEPLAPEFCRGKNFYFKLTVVNNTEGDISGTLTFSGHSGYDCDPGNIMVSIPRYKTYPQGVTENSYFFKVPNSVAAGQYSTSVSGNLSGHDVTCCMNLDIVQCSPWKIGSIVGWELVETGRRGQEEFRPAIMSLSQSYPNPFNANAVISYELGVSADVTLEVYNILGGRVATLVHEKQDAGEKSVLWDASDVSSGMYFYKLTTGDYSETKRMMLVK